MVAFFWDRLRRPYLWALLGAWLAAPPARATVYLNGTSIEGAALNQRLDGCSVTFDGHGNVFITAPNVRLEAVPVPPNSAADSAPTAPPTPPPARVAALPPPVVGNRVATDGPLTRKYFVVSQQSLPGMTQYDIDLYVNSRWVKKFHSDDEQSVAEVTSFLHPGANRVLFVAKKAINGTRKSFSPEATFRITLGEGEITSDQMVIDNPLITFQRSADQTEDTSQEFSLQAK